ncbi:Transcription initiation factor TFIID subunit 4B [Clonorchis sinensis]|uniref:Transcription initiation factor TFIID subunit 4B n=1 Tax=Clonorchis sinensis TaxID=79923 RepID=A0A8T1M200_CLOSI|nr:Transcription initiation factor TFIID subunit 4B [Clonorchis sinensis]
MGDRSSGNQVPVSAVRIPVSNIRPAPRSIGGSPNVNFTRSPMVNPVYLVPRSGLTNSPNVMHVRSAGSGQTVAPANGILTNTPILPPDEYYYDDGHFGVASTQSLASGAGKLVGFLNQLLELSKTVAADTHSAVLRLIQALVNAELDATSFCTQLRVNLKSANTSTDIGPFIKDNIDALRRDLANGVCRLPNIIPPSAPLSKDTCGSSAPPMTTGGLSTPNPGTVTVQVRPNASVSVPGGSVSQPAVTRLSTPSGTQPRIVGTLLSSVPTPVTYAGTVPSTIQSARVPHTQPPLLAPAPPRSSFSPLALSTTQLSTTSIGSLPKYRLTQPLSTVVPSSTSNTVAPHSSLPTVATTRLTAAATSIRTSYPTLRPVLAPSPSISSSTTVNLTPLKTASSVPSMVRPKLGIPSGPTSMNSNALSVSRTTSQLSGLSSSLFDRTSSLERKQDLNGDEVKTPTSLLSPSKDQPFFPPHQIRTVLGNHDPSLSLTEDAVVCLSHGLQALARSLLTRLSAVVSHRLERLPDDPRLVQSDCTREQLRFLQKLDEHDRMRQSELEKDFILKAAKSRSRNEDPDQIRMREMARRIATEDYEREKQHQANLTALHAIGPQRKRRFDIMDDVSGSALTDPSTGSYSGQDNVSTSSSQTRLSLLSANRLGVINPTSGIYVAQANSEVPQPNVFPAASLSNLSYALSSEPPSGGYSLAQSSRIHRATIKDIQLVLSRTPKLRRSLTYYRTHWHS